MTQQIGCLIRFIIILTIFHCLQKTFAPIFHNFCCLIDSPFYVKLFVDITSFCNHQPNNECKFSFFLRKTLVGNAAKFSSDKNSIYIFLMLRFTQIKCQLSINTSQEDNDVIKIVYQIFSIFRDPIVAFASPCFSLRLNDNDYQESSSTHVRIIRLKGEIMASENFHVCWR